MDGGGAVLSCKPLIPLSPSLARALPRRKRRLADSNPQVSRCVRRAGFPDNPHVTLYQRITLPRCVFFARAFEKGLSVRAQSSTSVPGGLLMGARRERAAEQISVCVCECVCACT